MDKMTIIVSARGKGFTKVLCIKPKSSFFHTMALKVFSVANFEVSCLFKTHYSGKFRIYEKMKVPSPKGEI